MKLHLMFFNKNHILERKDGHVARNCPAKHITTNLVMDVSRIFKCIEKFKFTIKLYVLTYLITTLKYTYKKVKTNMILNLSLTFSDFILIEYLLIII